MTKNRNIYRSSDLIQLPEKLDRQWVEKYPFPDIKSTNNIAFDFQKTRTIDSAGISFIHYLNKKLKKRGAKLVLKNISENLLSILEKWSLKPQDKSKPGEKTGFFTRIGDTTILVVKEIAAAVSVLAEMIYWGTFGLFKKRDFRKDILGEQMYLLGFKAFGIVGLLAFLIGIVLSLQTAMQLRMFGADTFLAPMITISMIREFGPLMTAIILAGRSGSATTAEIATMGVQEEIDALRTMSINPIQFVVVPKFWAITFTMPLLTIFATAAGIFGGYLIAIFYLKLSSSLFIGEVCKNIFFKDCMAGFLKSVVFSWLIVWIGAYYGFRVKGGAEEVGRETTASVVTCIFIIIVADAVFSFII